MKNLIEDQLIQNLIPDPKSIPNTDIAVGYLGKDERAGYWRIYMTQDLSEFMIVKEEDILNHQLIEKENSQMGIEYRIFWINSNAKIKYDSTRSDEDSVSNLLTGDVLKNYISQFESSDINGVNKMAPIYNKDFSKGLVCSVSILFGCATHKSRGICTIASGKLCQTRRLF